MIMNQNSLSKSMKATLEVDNLSVVTDVGEVFLDQVLEEGLLRDIPVLGAIIGVGKICNNVSDVLFANKLITFLTNIKDVDAETRREAIAKWEEDSHYRVKVGEVLLGMIQRCDDSQKAQWLSELFYELVLKKGWNDLFMRAEKVLSALSVMDILSFLRLPQNQYSRLSVEDAEPYAHSGLYMMEAIKEQTAVEIIVIHETKMQITEVGMLIYRILSR